MNCSRPHVTQGRWLLAGGLLAGLFAVVVPTLARGGEPCQNCTAHEPSRWSEDWYQLRADGPPGQRQHYKHGKVWPPLPRPAGEELPFMHKYYYAHFWPYPYYCADRTAVAAAFAQQASNGWAEMLTLYDYHFDRETPTLNRAGREHVRWILLNAPAGCDTAFVAIGRTHEESDARLASVQVAAAELVAGGPIPAFVLKYADTHGRPAVEIDLLRRAELRTQPVPRLNTNAATGVAGP